MSTWSAKVAAVALGEVLLDAPMSQRTSLRVGGPADLLFKPADARDLARVLDVLVAEGVPWMVVGSGANCLVADAGIRGAVIRLGPDFSETVVLEDGTITMSAGSPMARLIVLARERGLVGAEFLAAVPGTLGGAVAMNAGTKNGETKQILVAVEIARPGEARWIPAAELGMAYRTCHLPEGAVVTQVKVRLHKGDVAASVAAMEADKDYRRRTQPLTLPNCGSTFRNPPGDFAGRLIEAAGLKGRRIGNAQWSEQHANFLVNLGGATARDCLSLIELARGEVKKRSGVDLELEVKLVGNFDTRSNAG